MIGGDGVNCASCVTLGVVENRAFSDLGAAGVGGGMCGCCLKISLSFPASQHLDTGGLGLQNGYIFRVLAMAGPFPHGVTSKKKEGTDIYVES